MILKTPWLNNVAQKRINTNVSATGAAGMPFSTLNDVQPSQSTRAFAIT
jgi:hypothetical protein